MRFLLALATVASAVLACGSGPSYGKVDAGDIVLDGQVNADYFARQLGQLDPWFEACYARALRRDGDVDGVIELHLLGGGGKLLTERTENGTGNEELAECVANAVANISLVEAAGDEPWDFTAEWPVTFSIIRRE